MNGRWQGCAQHPDCSGAALGAAEHCPKRAFEASLEASVAVEQNQPDAIVGKPVHQRGGQQHIAEAHHGAHMVEWHAQAGRALDLDADRVVLEVQVGFGVVT
jgi:phosphomannomutase